MVRQFIQPDDSVLELGGCLGVVSCVTNKRLGAKACHVVVEANPNCIPPLTRNKELNQASFLIDQCAVTGETDAQFNVDPANITGGLMQDAGRTAIQIPAKSLGRLHQEHGPFNVLICDIEGSELGVFEQSAELLKSYRLVIVELHDAEIGLEGVNRCREILRKAGMEIVASDNGVEAWRRKDNGGR